MSELYYHKPLVIAYSGGKDSDVLLRLAEECLKPDQYEVINSHTTADAPETVYHIHKVFANLKVKGIKATVHIPRDKDGKAISMWTLIPQKKMPPTGLVRYCCSILKERTTPNRMKALGVREDESVGRRGRDDFSCIGSTKSRAMHFSRTHAVEVFRESERERRKTQAEPNAPDPMDCLLIEWAKKEKELVINPIYRWTTEDVFAFATDRHIELNPLYAEGFTRVGCVGCPLGGCKSQYKEFARWPKYRAMYVSAFDRMIKARKEAGLKTNWKSGEEVMQWWIRDPCNIPGQMQLDDFM